MKYTIIILDHKNNISKYVQDSLDQLDIVVYYIDQKSKLVERLSFCDIDLVVLNTKIIDLNSFSEVLDQLNIDYDQIPILVLDDNKIDYDHKLLIYDYTTSDILPHKIKFCKHLYQKEMEHKKQIQTLLYVDRTTDLPNRTKLIKDIQNDYLGIKSLAMIDIHSFKDINDFFGFRVGDNILRSVSKIITSKIESYNNELILYKFPVDLFCLANIKLENEKFKNIVFDILSAIKNKIYKEGDHEIDLRATAGITFSSKNNKIVTSDLALCAAKEQHKDLVVFYEELDNLNDYKNNMLWTKKLKHALENDNIIVYYQPLVNNTTMNVDKYECLVRMKDEDKIISPFFFLELSKKANLYRNITKIVIDKSFKQFSKLGFEFSVNVSYDDIEDEDFLPFVKEKLTQYGVAHKVVWEILEDETIKNYDIVFKFIKEVKSMGCKVAIDDFGSGYSNFEHLLKMDVDYLKIDASLIKNIAVDDSSYKIVKTIIDFAKSLDMETICEYVENKEIFNIVKRFGSTYSQGYYFSAPIEEPNIYNF